jgi:hypothetical protein
MFLRTGPAGARSCCTMKHGRKGSLRMWPRPLREACSPVVVAVLKINSHVMVAKAMPRAKRQPAYQCIISG